MGIQDTINSVNKTVNKVNDTLTVAAIGSELLSRVLNAANPQPTKVKEDTGIAPLNEFISTVKRVGLAKANHFTFTFAPPFKSNIFDSPTGGRFLNLMCSSTTLPGLNVATTPTRTIGESYEMPTDKIYSPIASTFYVDANLHVKNFFDSWVQFIQDPVSRNFEFYDNYTTQVAITVFDSYGYPHYVVVFDNAYPKTVDDIHLAHNAADILQLGVTWSYRRWQSYLVDNTINSSLRKPTIEDQLLGYVGQFKDYQEKFNTVSGIISRSDQLIKSGNYGGLVTQSFGGLF